ncbi:hypothetical protein [Corallococcus exercitus]|uniref:hypothetical protein n=1 Tax=Corallococcus exercitus TaxID=2316736 RepID=UPI0035D4AE22
MPLPIHPKALPPPPPRVAPPPPPKVAGEGQTVLARKVQALSTTAFEPASSDKPPARLGEPEYARTRPAPDYSVPFFPQDLSGGSGDTGSTQANGGIDPPFIRILNSPVFQHLRDAVRDIGDGLEKIGDAVTAFLQEWVPGKEVRNTDSSSGEGDSRSASPTANGSGTGIA